MSEKVTLDLERWNGLSADELGLTAEWLKVFRSRHENDIGQQFNILNIDARRSESDPTILTSTSFDYRIDELLERRMSILATNSNARVIVSEIPGITLDRDDPFNTKGAWQTLRQTVLAFSGNFDPLALEQLRAIDAEVGLESGSEVQLFGESLGAYAVAAMARVMAQHKFNKGLRITHMDLIEPVNAYGNYTVMHQIKMLKNLATREDRLRNVYLGENTHIGHGEVGAFEKQSPENMRIDKYIKIRQIPATYLTGAGLRKGMHAALKDALNDTSSDGPDLRRAQISLARGVDSSVSFETDLSSASETIRDNAGQARTVSLEAPLGDSTPISHHVLNSFGRLASYSEARAKIISEG